MLLLTVSACFFSNYSTVNCHIVGSRVAISNVMLAQCKHTILPCRDTTALPCSAYLKFNMIKMLKGDHV